MSNYIVLIDCFGQWILYWKSKNEFYKMVSDKTMLELNHFNVKVSSIDLFPLINSERF